MSSTSVLRRTERDDRALRRRGMTIAVATAILSLFATILVAPPAAAADAALTVRKVVDGVEQATHQPGDEFTYTITVGCDDSDCVDAQLADEIPPAFAGFEILGAGVRPTSQPATLELVGCDATVTAECALDAVFQQPLDGGGIGIRAGDTYQVTLTLKVPQDLPPTWPSNGVAVPNTAAATATTADSVADTATVTVEIPRVIDVTVGKQWQPASQQFQPGAASTIALSVANASNVDAASLSLQDPAAADDAAAGLDASNPFRLVDFTGFGAVTAPEGADRVAVDAYVYNAGSWTWVSGEATAIGGIRLPDGVDPGDVGGLRFTFTSSQGAALAAAGAAGSVEVGVAQRSADRNTGDSLIAGAEVTNRVSGTATAPDAEPVTETAIAPYAIGGLTVAIEATKSIAPARIPAGTAATATIGARNDSNGPLSTLTLTDAEYFTDGVTFDGFTGPLAYPAGAASGAVSWTFSDGTVVDTAFGDGETPGVPAAPAGAHLTGFALTLEGSIAPGAVFNASYRIGTAADVVESEARSPIQLPNTVVVSGENPAGSASDSATAPLAVYYPDIRIALDKKLSPAAPVTAGGTVVVQLPTTSTTDSAFVDPSTIVVEDVWREAEADDFWNAFTPVGIAPTQVLSGSTLTVEALTPSGWQQVTVVAPAGATEVFSGDLAELAPGIDPATVTGLRYTFSNAAGFPAGTTVSPNTVFEARAALRDGGDPTATPGGDPVRYENVATAQAEGIVAGGTRISSDEVTDAAPAEIVAFDGDGTLMADKTWTPSSLSSQSGASATSRLSWAVTATGFESVTIADPNGGETMPAETVFQAFDLREIRPSNDARWKWDSVSSIELFIGGSWTTVPAPSGSWMNGASFKGHALTAAQSAGTTGVRITAVPNDAARAASADPLRPAPGSGVTTSAVGSLRVFDLVWRLRNVVRVADAEGPWVTATHGYNDADPATIWNTVGVSGVQHGEPVGPHGARDDITLIDQPPAVVVAKSADRDVVPIPVPGEVPADGYPQIVWTIDAHNDSASRASYLRVTDPMACTDAAVEDCVSPADGWEANPYAGVSYDPATNPFERIDLIGIAFAIPGNAGVDSTASTVTLWKRGSDGTLSTQSLSITAAAALTGAQLADVVGVSVLYQGTGPETAGGTIATDAKLGMTLTTRLRVTERSTGENATEPVVTTNDAFAQSYDPVLFATATPYDTAGDDVQLVTGLLDVTAAKTITPATLLERDRHEPVGVRLQATDGESTVATQRVTVEDSDPAFWSRFRLASLDAVEFPGGADRVRVDVLVGDEWIEGVPAATAALPDAPLDDVIGIRLVFTREDGGVFSRTAPPAHWTATADLTVHLLETVRGTDEAIAFPSTVENEVNTESARADGDVYPAATADAADDIALTTGTAALDVAKTPENNVHTVEAATTNPWTLEFTNAGTGYLTVEHVIDTLPTSLEPDFAEEPAFETSDGGLLSTDVAYEYDAATHRIAFTWPEGGRRMAPGETFTITLGIVLKPGLTQGERATNQFVVTTAQELSSCANTSGNGQGILAGAGVNECGTTNFVEPIPGASLATFKGVRGEIDGDVVDGAVNTVRPDGPCLTDAEGYYRTPCAANTVVGATDAWKLEAVNSGTSSYRSMTLVEPLPTPGDRMLATGGSRGSTYRPVFDGAAGLDIAVPAGTTVRWQVTTGADVCVGSGSSTTWPADPTCDADSWTDSDAFSGDWTTVTGLRVLVDFTTSTAGSLAPGGAVTVRYQTINAPATADDPDLAPIEVPVTEQFAWNQFGAQAVLSDGGTLRRAPVKAGVTLVSGPIEVQKQVSGPAARYAADAFVADVACTVAGATLDLGPAASVTLDAGSGYAARIDGIPLGAECSVAEQGPAGRFGETSRTVVNPVLPVTQIGGDEVPAAQVATLGNVYEFGGLSIAKHVDTLADVGSFGPFAFALSCTTSIGDEVELAASDRSFSLAEGETHAVTAGTIPVGSTCEVRETDADDADATTFSGEGVTDAGDGSATVAVGAAAEVVATNRYEAGTLSVLKTVVGDGAAEYGDGPFSAAVSCTYDGDVIYTEPDLAIVPDEPSLVPAQFPAGTVCEVAEVLTGGATETENPPAVVIVGPEEGQPLGAVTALVTNDFRIGGLVIEKERIGDGVQEFGAGPFEAQAVCTWVKDDATLTVPLAGGGIVTLSEENGYRARIDGIVVGAECAVTETDQGLATAVTMSPEDGVVTVPDPEMTEDVATVVITNRFDVGQLEIEKTADRTAALVGETVRYTITVRNSGQIDASDLTVTDSLPQGAAFVAANPEARVDGGTVVWQVADLAVGEAATMTVDVRFDRAGETVNRATVTNPVGPWRSVDGGDSCPDDDTAACARVVVTEPLATTGGAGWLVPGGLAAMLLALGAALLAVRRRHRA
ncbi:DUF5979 domain-containing protein [Microbacterium cremeum]|uniref:DUF5979 domain-containing protein n=1 Tax=Microbacterium cremeum TaxID=2782169 RepID=UPI0018896FAF|nr:DUF5979 domain-containing protein [Microbacterium cremeum]